MTQALQTPVDDWSAVHVGWGSLRSNEMDNSRRAVDVIAEIAGDAYSFPVESIRQALCGEDEASAEEQKKNLPAVTWSGTFSKRRNDALLVHSGLICADLDDLEDARATKARLAADPYVAAAFLSPSGVGVKALFRLFPVPKDAREHRDAFAAVERHMLEAHGLPIDPACKDVARLCFLSWDPDLFVGDSPSPIRWREFDGARPFKPAFDMADTPSAGAGTPGDDYDARGDVQELLKAHGWKPLQGGKYWTRPGKKSGISASLNVIPGRFWCFSSSTDFQANHLYRPWHVFAVLEHRGDFKAAASDLGRQGYGTPARAPREKALSALRQATAGQAQESPSTGATTAQAAAIELPPILSVEAEDKTPMEKPPELIQGVLYQGAKMMIAGPSKARKTFSLMDLALSVGSGLPWLGFPTHQTGVLYVNFELQDFASRERRQDIVKGKFRAVHPDVNFWHLRGALAKRKQNPRQTYEAIVDGLASFTSEHGIGLIIIDPVYKLMQLSGEENKAEDVGRLLSELDMITMETRAAVAFVHHFAKGNASGKDAIDRASGSGVWARDPDTLFTLTPHEEEDCMVVDASLRNFKAIEPFGIRWRYPVWERDTSIDTQALRQAKKSEDKGGRPNRTTVLFESVLPRYGNQVTRENVESIAAIMGCSVPTVWRRWKELKESN